MQFEDPRSILEAAAATPSRGLDARRLLKRGHRMRRARYASVAAGLAVTLAAASASFGMLADQERPGPAGVGACDRDERSVSIFLRPGATDAEVEAARAELEGNPDVQRVEYVSAEETSEAMRAVTEEWATSFDGPGPAQFRVEAASDAAAERLAGMRGGVIVAAIRGSLAEDVDCLAALLCGRPSPLMASIFLRGDATGREIRETRLRLLSMDGVEEVEYVSQEAAYEEFRRLYEDQAELYITMSPDDLPASFRIAASDEATLEELRYFTSSIVEEVRTSDDFRERICAGETAPSPAPSLIGGDDSGPGEESVRSLDLVPDVQPDVIGAECGIAPLHVSGIQLPDSPNSKWCRFDLVVFNSGTRPAAFDYEDVALHTAVTPVAPWMPSGEPPGTAGSLFAQPVAAGETAMGEVIYVLRHHQAPTQLELWESPRNIPIVFLLAYEDCLLDLRDDPDGRCAFEATLREPPPYEGQGRVEVSLYHCGIETVVFGGREWVVPAPPFDATNAPRDFVGEGRLTQTSEDEALYVDESGARITFRSLEGWHPPPCA